MLKLGIKINFNLSEEDYFYIDGRFNNHILKQTSVSTLVKEISPAFQSVKDYYHDAMKGDRRLLGQEKIKLQDLLDSLFHLFLAIRLHLGSSGDEMLRHFTAYPDENHPKFTYSEVETGFQISGKLNISRVNKIQTFEEWFNQSLSKKIKNFLEELKTSWQDKKLTQEEIDNLIFKIDSLLYSFIIIHFKLKIGKMRT
jgi:hypothetical protein